MLCVIAFAIVLGIVLWAMVKKSEHIQQKKKEQRRADRAARKQKAFDEDRARPPKVIVSEQVPTKIKRGRPSVILLVEDSQTMMLALRKVLERWNYKVITATDGRRAWAELQKHKPDLVISDIEMPELSGIELLKLIRADLVLMDLPVILITGNPYQHLQAGQQVGVDGLLLKPFEDRALIDQVRYILQE